MTRLSGHRVRLVPLRDGDRQGLAIALNDPEAWGNRQLRDDPPRPFSDGELDELFAKMNSGEHGEHYVIEVADSPVGHAGAERWWDAMTPDVSVFVAPPSRRMGFGSEAMIALLDHVFTTTVAEAAHGWVPSWHEGGGRFLEVLGFREAGRSRRAGLKDGVWYEEVAYDLLRAEWEALRGDRR